MPPTKTLEERLAAALPLRLYQALVRRPLIAFTYHAISPDPPAYIRRLYPSKTPREFEQDLLYLKAHYRPVSYGEVLDHAAGRHKLPERACIITIDDGYRECYTQARPLLLEHGVPCIFFLATDFLDNGRLFYRNKYSLCADALLQLPDAEAGEFLEAVNRWHGLSLGSREAALGWLRGLKEADERLLNEACQQLGVDAGAVLAEAPFLTRAQARQLAADGFTLGAHSRRHVKFDLLSRAEIEEEIVASCREVAELGGGEIVPFAFPFSGAGVDRRFLGELVGRYDFLTHLFDTQGVRRDVPFVVNRVWADRPPAPRGGGNLERLLHAAYRENMVWRRRYYASRLRDASLGSA